MIAIKTMQTQFSNKKSQSLTPLHKADIDTKILYKVMNIFLFYFNYI